MRILRGLKSLPVPDREKGCVATVGVFDGVHLGHFHVLRKVVARAKELGAVPTMVTFAGHPKSLLVGQAPQTITSLEHRLVLFERAGIETTVVLEFTPELRKWEAEEFVEEVLIRGLGLKELVFGFDSKFGKGRGGTPESLGPLAKAHGFTVNEVPAFLLNRHPVSSTAVRESVGIGDLKRATEMLGRPVSVLGSVHHGEKRGREIGFPTANLNPHHELRPPKGVYAALTFRRDALLPAIVNIGDRPTFDGTDVLIEVHLLDFEEDIYGEVLEVFFLEFLRDELEFSDADALAEQITLDVSQARKICQRAHQDWRIPGEFLPIEGQTCYSFAPETGG